MKMTCEKCGVEMINKSKGPYLHFVCPNCGHVLTTYDYNKENPIKTDQTIYSIKLIDNKVTPELIKIISKANGKNYLQCKKMVENNDIIFNGKAVEIVQLIHKFNKLNIKTEILPYFPYEI